MTELVEKRENGERDKCAISAWILVAPGTPEIPCLVENLSERGARLRLQSETFVPPKVNLSLPLFDGQTYARVAEVRWRIGAAIGVRFVG